MKNTLTNIIAVLTLTMTAASAANANQNIKAPTDKALDVKSVTLAIKSPASNACPSEATIKAWIYTNKAGPVDYFTARKGQGQSAMKTVQAVKAGNKYVATITRKIEIAHTIDAEYRMFAKGAGAYEMSNWVPLKASCKIGLGGNGQIKAN